MKKLTKKEQIVQNVIIENFKDDDRYTLYQCDDHGVYAHLNSSPLPVCPHCKKECEVYVEPKSLIPAGYIPGVFRGENGQNQVTHIYKGDFDDPGLPMCKKGWHYQSSYSIFRNNISKKGICKTCLKRAEQGMEGVQYGK